MSDVVRIQRAVVRIQRANGAVEEIPVVATTTAVEGGVQTTYDPPIDLSSGDEILDAPGFLITFTS